MCVLYFLFFFFFNDTATTEIYTLSLHDALPISTKVSDVVRCSRSPRHPRSRATRAQSLSRSLAAGGLATCVRRTGDRPGTGRRLPHGRRRRTAAALAARLFPAARRPQGADHLRSGPHP